MMNEPVQARQRQLKTFPLVLKSMTSIAPKVKHFVFTCEKNADGADFSYTAGQFITLHFEYEGRMLNRSYSIATTPENYKGTRCVEFAAGYVENGPATQLLFNLKLGDVLNATGPFGRLVLKEELPKRYIFVSTSTGVTPFRAMFHTLTERFQKNPDLNVVLLEGVQKKEDLLYREDFVSFAQKNPQFAFHACYSREKNEDLTSYEHAGYVQSVFSTLHLNPENDVVYLCGNPQMIDDAFALLKELSFDAKNVFREKYISAK